MTTLCDIGVSLVRLDARTEVRGWTPATLADLVNTIEGLRRHSALVQERLEAERAHNDAEAE